MGEEPPYEYDEVYEDLKAFLEEDDDDEEVALASLRASKVPKSDVEDKTPSGLPMPPQSFSHPPATTEEALDDIDWDNFNFVGEDERSSDEEDEDYVEDSEYDDYEDEDEEEISDWDWEEGSSSEANAETDDQEPWVPKGWGEGFADLAVEGEETDQKEQGDEYEEEDEWSYDDDDDDDYYQDEDTDEDELDEDDELEEEESDPKKSKKATEAKGGPFDKLMSLLPSGAAEKWNEIKKQAAAELKGKDSPEDDDEPEDDLEQESGPGKVSAALSKPPAMFFGTLGRVPVVGKPFAAVANNNQLLKLFGFLLPVLVIMGAALFFNSRAVPNTSAYGFPDGGHVTASQTSIQEGNVKTTLRNDGEVIARVTLKFKIHAVNPVNPITWFKPSVVAECTGKDIEIATGGFAEVSSQCSGSGVWQRAEVLIETSKR